MKVITGQMAGFTSPKAMVIVLSPGERVKAILPLAKRGLSGYDGAGRAYEKGWRHMREWFWRVGARWRAWLGRFGVSASTCRLWRAAREAGQPWWRFVHTYAYARWPYGYIGSGIGERWQRRLLLPFFAPFLVRALFPRRWANEYHGKVMPLERATRLVQIKEDVNTVVPEQVMTFEGARDLILSDPDHIAVLDCPCRVARKHPCLPLDVCLIVGEPFASFVLEHHPDRARAITSQEAVDILAAEAARGHVHHAFFKRAMLDRFYAICNCCSCCCGAMSAHAHGTPMVVSSGYFAQIDADACRACARCVQVCPFGAIQAGNPPQVDGDACMGCGVCARACPAGACRLARDESKPLPWDVPG